MTQAFNLAQLANNLNTSGQVDATDGLSGLVANANLASSGTASASTFLRGDRTFATVPQKVVQTVVSTYKDAPTTSSRSFVDSGWSTSITPTSASNTIIVQAYISYSASSYTNGGFNGFYFRLVNGAGTPLATGNADGARQQVTFGGFAIYMGGNLMMKSMAFEWSPGATSAQTIKLQWFCDAETLILNRSFNANNVTSGNLSGLSTMVLMEIAP